MNMIIFCDLIYEELAVTLQTSDNTKFMVAVCGEKGSLWAAYVECALHCKWCVTCMNSWRSFVLQCNGIIKLASAKGMYIHALKLPRSPILSQNPYYITSASC